MSDVAVCVDDCVLVDPGMDAPTEVKMIKCGEPCEVYSRVVGYYRPVKNWNKGKRSEWADRKPYKGIE